MCIAAFADAVAWPLVVLAICFLLKDDLRVSLSRILSKNWWLKLPGGVEAKLSSAVHDQNTHPSVEVSLSDQVALAPHPRPFVQQTEAELARDLEEVPRPEQVPRLLRALAFRTATFAHEFVYSRIFGSQIQALKILNTREKISYKEAFDYHAMIVEKFPDFYSQMDFSNWQRFLVNNGLVVFNDGFYTISTQGRDLLVYITDMGLTENKVL